MTNSRRWIVESPVGFIELVAEGELLSEVNLGAQGPAKCPPDNLLQKASEELGLYFAGKLRDFTIPLKPQENLTPYLKRVVETMATIPYGTTITYGDLAKKVGGSPRSVGRGCGSNKLPIIIPCHRVVAAKGLGGYAGDWEKGKALSVKKLLLDLEMNVIMGD